MESYNLCIILGGWRPSNIKMTDQMAETVYVPKSSGKEREFTVNGNQFTTIKINFKVDELIKFCQEHVNEKGYISFDVNKRKEKGQYGETHSIVLNDYKKEETTKKAAWE
jgi:hypothetical protein